MTPDWSFRNKRVLVVGPSASGKTTWALEAIRGFRGPRFLFDQKGEFAHRLQCSASHSPRQCMEAVRQSRPVCFNPHSVFPGRTEEGFAWFSALAFAYGKELPGEKLFVVDEVHHFTGTGAGQLPQGLRMILETGRCYRLHSIAISHGANLVNNRLRNQFSHVVAFASREENALRFLEGVGLQAEEVTRLAPLHFVERDVDASATRAGRIIWRGNRPSVQAGAASTDFPGKAKTPPPPASGG